MLEDYSGNQAPIAIQTTAATLLGIVPTATPGVASHGGFAFQSGSVIHFGSGLEPPSAIGTYLRDNGTKESWFLPRSLCSFGLPLGQAMKYKLRQITIGPTPLASYEQLTDTGPVLKAISTFPGTTIGYPWLTNFKV